MAETFEKAKYQTPTVESKPHFGRPWKKFDLKIVEGLASIHCTHEEMACVLGCEARTIAARMADTPDFHAAYKKGWGAFNVSLRRMQFETARKGNATMQIWLGKNNLGQSDAPPPPVEVEEHSSLAIGLDTSDGIVPIIVTHDATIADLRKQQSLPDVADPKS